MRVPILVAVIIGLFFNPLPGTAQSIHLVSLANGLSRPVAIEPMGDGSGRLVIAEQGGLVKILQHGNLQPDPLLDIRNLVSCCNERGLLGIAFHPRYAENRQFFVNYTNTGFDSVVARFSADADGSHAEVSTREILLTIAQPFANHNGGHLAFGPDGYLYIGTGDGGSAGDPQNNAQNPLTLLGKMLRLDVDNGVPYGIPPDNPFAQTDLALDEIWAGGLRNPFRYSFDRVTGDLFIADVGQDLIEEVNFYRIGTPTGLNYGWRLMEGSQCFNPSNNCNDGSLTLPAFEYGHTSGRCSVTGGYRYRGQAIPHLAGDYLFADFCTGEIFAATQTDSGWQQRVLTDTTLRITTFGQDERGELLVADLNGAVFRLAAPVSVAPGSGTYLASHVVDLAVIFRSVNAVELSEVQATLNGADISAEFRSCAEPELLAEGGISFVCRGVPLNVLQPGTYTLSIGQGEDQAPAMAATVTWEILESL